MFSNRAPGSATRDQSRLTASGQARANRGAHVADNILLDVASMISSTQHHLSLTCGAFQYLCGPLIQALAR